MCVEVDGRDLLPKCEQVRVTESFLTVSWKTIPSTSSVDIADRVQWMFGYQQWTFESLHMVAIDCDDENRGGPCRKGEMTVKLGPLFEVDQSQSWD
jgi:hypothetical protein